MQKINMCVPPELKEFVNFLLMPKKNWFRNRAKRLLENVFTKLQSTKFFVLKVFLLVSRSSMSHAYTDAFLLPCAPNFSARWKRHPPVIKREQFRRAIFLWRWQICALRGRIH